LLTAGSTLVLEWTYDATHIGKYEGPTGTVPASGNRVSLHGVDVFDVTDDHIVRYRSYFDHLDLLTQLGATAGRPQPSMQEKEMSRDA
jgi:predicted ester cyclase